MQAVMLTDMTREDKQSVTVLPATPIEASPWWWDRSSLRWHLLCAFWRMEKPAVLVSLARRLGGGKISAAVQRFLLSECIYGQVSCKFPPDEAYTARVIKAFVEAVEDEVRRPVHLSSDSPPESHHRSISHVHPEPQVFPESDIASKSMKPESISGEIRHRVVLELGPEAGEGAGVGALSGEGGEGVAGGEGGEEDEEEEEGVSAELCDALCDFLTTRSSSARHSGWCHRTFAYSPPLDNHANGHLVSVRMAHNMLQGSTGCHVWPASFVLCELILSHQWLVTQRACLEVGSGSGLLATCLARAGPSKVVCTDGDSETLDNLGWNLTQNGIHVSDDDQQESGTELSEKLPEVTCTSLPWESVTHSDVEVMNPDVIFGADVVYDPTVIPSLVTLLALFLHPKKMSSASTQSPHPNLDGEGVGVDVCNSCLRWMRANSSCIDKDWSLKETCSLLSDCTRQVAGFRKQCCIKVAFMTTAVRNESTLKLFETESNRAGLVVKDITNVCEAQPRWFHGDLEMWTETVRVHCLFSGAHTSSLRG